MTHPDSNAVLSRLQAFLPALARDNERLMAMGNRQDLESFIQIERIDDGEEDGAQITMLGNDGASTADGSGSDSDETESENDDESSEIEDSNSEESSVESDNSDYDGALPMVEMVSASSIPLDLTHY